MGPTRIYLIRHGETTWNIERRYQGEFDSPLSARGWAQAGRTRDALRAVPLRSVYCSPLARAVETARVVAEPHGLPVVPVDALREIRVGKWEGLTVAEIEAQYAEVAAGWYAAPHLARIPGGESIVEMRDRGAAAVEEIRAHHPGEAVAVVAHGGVNKAILLTVLGAPLSCYWRIRQHNGGISVLEYDGDRARVLTLNATAHLENAHLENA